jgi:hypothetical protein
MSQLKDLLLAHPDWIAPRSDQHTVIGMPDSRDHRKTFAEPGGSFSPGVGSFGVSLWVYDRLQERLFAPEEMPLAELKWEWEQGYLPVLNSSWLAGSLEIGQQLFATSLTNLENIVNSLKLTITNPADRPASFSLYLVIRPYGPAGGKLPNLSFAGASSEVTVNNRVAILAGQAWDAAGALGYTESGQEISNLLRKGQVPASQSAEDKLGLCSGVLAYNLNLPAQARHELEFDFFVHPLEHDYLKAFQAYHSQSYETKLAQVSEYWEKRLKVVQLELPDKRFSNAFYSMLAQHLIATVDNEVRISTVTYPLLWLRDGVYIINALDKAGLHQEVRQQLARLQPRLFAGGFGAEPDAFGEGIWPFYTHFKLTGDRDWLASVYSALKERADWIIKARHTRQYLYADTEVRIPNGHYAADSDLICEPAKDGLVQGRMDWHRPLVWINAFSLLGLWAAAELAGILGYADDAKLYQQEASALREALYKYAAANFGQNERDFVCAVWPTQAFEPGWEPLAELYEKWWHKARLDEQGRYKPELLWKYFELGQAHNYLLLGERTRALETVNYYLDHHDVTNLYGWLEDAYDIAENWSQIEGWYKLPSRQPHGWVSSEFLLLLRDLWLYEKGESLVLGQGVPAGWLQKAKEFEILNAPSAFGPLDFKVIVPASNKIEVEVFFHSVERLPHQVEICLPWPGKLVAATKGSVEEAKVIIPRCEYLEQGRVRLTVTTA